MEHTTTGKIDSAIAATLIASPAWASWLGSLNQFLTSIMLLCGVALGFGRLWLFVKRLRAGPKP